MREINEIILHCADTVEGKAYYAKDIDKWHKEKGWKGIGYHYVVDLDGTIEKGRNEDEIGAHCSGHNSDTIGICYIGGRGKDGKAKDTRTDEQKKSLYKLVNELVNKYELTIDDIHCHNEYSTKECPSFSIEQFKDEIMRFDGD